MGEWGVVPNILPNLTNCLLHHEIAESPKSTNSPSRHQHTHSNLKWVPQALKTQTLQDFRNLPDYLYLSNQNIGQGNLHNYPSANIQTCYNHSKWLVHLNRIRAFSKGRPVVAPHQFPSNPFQVVFATTKIPTSYQILSNKQLVCSNQFAPPGSYWPPDDTVLKLSPHEDG